MNKFNHYVVKINRSGTMGIAKCSPISIVGDYSRISRYLLVTAGDDGSVLLWDTTGRSPKIIASVGLDKKLDTHDSGSRRPSSFISYEAPFSSLAFREDSWILAAGTSSGRVVFYDVHGKPQPFTVLRAYSTSEVDFFYFC
ncbi:hypothetical protein GH714_011837 [Hevea brasiliensis]|uniref:Uncharacterized protein n=1 Tax=Hevea brasiliensis TaxID=3981 RepID=A0A6A6N453_HEVBR|nr:hypothetical protein GH714_011837 [Hevea brasiliensis]